MMQTPMVTDRQETSSWMAAIAANPAGQPSASAILGIFPGEGVGPEVVGAALQVLDAVEGISPVRTIRKRGGEIGLKATGTRDGAITDNAVEFCQQIFDDGGALLCGPAGGRFVYDLRLRFDLFCKLVPLVPNVLLRHSNRLKAETLQGVDILVVRDNAGGIYQGSCVTRRDAELGPVVEHRFSYSQHQVQRIVEAGARLAKLRRGRMDVVIKEGGVPTISGLWRKSAETIAAKEGIDCGFLNADFAAYKLIQEPQAFDVLVAPNMLGDILADLGAVLIGSRGLSYSGNFSAEGLGVYQTGHGAAYDLAGTDRANPVAQIFSLAMLLRESFGWRREARLIQAAITAVWRAGWRTDDLAEPGCRLAGTQQMGALIAQAVTALSGSDLSA